MFLPGDLCAAASEKAGGHYPDEGLYVTCSWLFSELPHGPHLRLYGDAFMSTKTGTAVFLAYVAHENKDRNVCMVLYDGAIGYSWESHMKKVGTK